MAISDALAWRLNNGGTAADLYADINNFLATNPTAEQTQAAMAQYGISAQDVASATGGKSGGLLSGNIMAGASWNSSNTALQNQLTEATGQQTANYAVAGSTTTDTLNQLNSFLAGGGQFDPNATVFLQAGGVDFITGVDKAVVKDNLDQIVKTLGDQGVNVVLTGSPYAKSVDDVINNNFDPKVDQIYKDVAKANSNVALVGTQGEILQNKKLLVDALHTNAEGTSIYNQSVIDALSQFKNEVPSSTPQDIAQVQKSNTVAVTPPVITQAASNPVVAQALAVQAPNIQDLVASGALQPNQATLIGDTYYQPIYTQLGSGEDAQLGPLENVVTYKANQNQTGGNVNWFDPTGQYQQTTQQQKVPSFLGGLADVANDPFVQAALLASGAGGAIGNALGLTGSTAQAVGTGLLKSGTAAAGGASLEDALKVGLLSGGLVYGGNALNNYLTTGSTADVGMTERQFAIADAKNLASQGLSTNQIADTLSSAGYNDAIIDRAITAVGGSTASTLPTPGAVNITGTTTPAVSAGGLLSSLVAPTTTLTTPSVTTPVTQAGTVNVTGATQPQMVDQATLALVNSQIAANAGTPTNMANVQVTGNKPATTQEITNAILATVPNVTLPQAQAQAQVLITSGQNLTTNDLVAAVASVSPNITNNVAEQIITSSNSNAIKPVVNALVSTVAPTVSSVAPTVSSNLANVQVTGDRLASTQEVANAVLATVPNITPQQAQTQAEVIVTSGQNLKVSDLVSAVASVSPNITNNVAEQIITSKNSTAIPSVVNSLATVAASTIPASTMPTQTITAPRQSAITSDITAAAIPLIQPSTPLTLPEIPKTMPTTSNPLLNAAGTAGLSSLLGSSAANLISGGLGTAGNLLQMQTSREAALKAQAMIDAETKAAKDAAQFRPVGMTTRFGTSQFNFDPATGRLTSAGYNLTPDVKAQQDRLMALSNQGLTQAEAAQQQFAPLQTGAQRLFGLGNQYLAQSPEQVAQNYLNQQMALLQPGRELVAVCL
jgi:hypothetical protein